MNSLGDCTFFGSGANGFQDEPGFEDATPPALLAVLLEQWQPVLNGTTAKQTNSRAQQRRNQATEALMAYLLHQQVAENELGG